MTRKALPLLILVVAVLASTTFTGCTKPTKSEQITALQVENANLKGQLRNQDDLMQDVRDLEDEASMARQEAQEARMQLAQAKTAPVARGSGEEVIDSISGKLLFAAGSDKLTSAGKRALDNVVSKIRNRYSGRLISVEGHPDSAPLVKTLNIWHTNMWLAANRARAVADYLMSKGVDENSLSVVGHGASPAGGRKIEVIVSR